MDDILALINKLLSVIYCIKTLFMSVCTGLCVKEGQWRRFCVLGRLTCLTAGFAQQLDFKCNRKMDDTKALK